MITVGLTGSIAMGKSEVAKVLRQKSVPVFDADQVVHELYSDGTAARRLAPLFPNAVQGNQVNRTELSAAILRDPTRLQQLEEIVHPLVRQAEAAFIKSARLAGEKLVILDLPLLFETARADTVDFTVVVSAPPSLQRQRALARPGMSPEKLDTILQRQMPDQKKRQLADFIIENNADLDHLAAEVDRVLTTIIHTTPRKTT